MTCWEAYESKLFENPEFCAEYEALELEFAIIQAMVDARKSAGLTQQQISERTGISQGDISKLENGSGNPTLETLKRLASAMGMVLKIEFLPRLGKQE